MQTEVVHSRSWQEFKTKLLERLYGSDPFSRGIYLFRGQRDSNWALKSSYDRWFDRTDLPESQRVVVTEQLLAQFQRDVAGLSSFEGFQDRTRFLALAQHYGLPTRLLDWTESPYIASFFAFAEVLEERSSSATVAIMALDTRSYVWNGRGVTLMSVPPERNMRLHNQDGKFTLLESAATCLEDHLQPLAAEEPWPLYKFVIPANEARLALSELDIMGINACRVYPDLQGCSLSAKLAVLMKSDFLIKSARSAKTRESAYLRPA